MSKWSGIAALRVKQQRVNVAEWSFGSLVHWPPPPPLITWEMNWLLSGFEEVEEERQNIGWMNSICENETSSQRHEKKHQVSLLIFLKSLETLTLNFWSNICVFFPKWMCERSSGTNTNTDDVFLKLHNTNLIIITTAESHFSVPKCKLIRSGCTLTNEKRTTNKQQKHLFLVFTVSPCSTRRCSAYLIKLKHLLFAIFFAFIRLKVCK